jgi:hypothetical protein
MSLSIVSTPYTDKKSGTISIKPYVDPEVENLGLQKYNMALYDGVFHEEQLACIERNGILRYITGLNEFAPEVKLIQDKETREAKIKDIRETVAQLEKELAANVIDPNDSDFWNKVKLLRHDNNEFWNKITIRCGNETVPLDPAKDPYDLIKLRAIEAGGFPMVASSFEAARSQATPPKFFLDKYVETVSTKTEVTKLKNKALSELEKMFEKNQNKLFYVAKVTDANSVQYKKSTPIDIIYANMDSYIMGDSVERNPKRAAQNFLDNSKLDMETLKIRAMIKDATFYKIIAAKSDGFIYHIDSQVQMGRSAAECLEFLKNPLHEKTLEDLTKKIEKFWNQ